MIQPGSIPSVSVRAPEGGIINDFKWLLEETVQLSVNRPNIPRVKLDSPDAIVEHMRPARLFRPDQEAFWVLPLNRKNVCLGRYLVTLGSATSCLVHPMEVLRAVIAAGATAYVCTHNHPSGDPSPSSADVQLTRRLREASQAVGAMGSI